MTRYRLFRVHDVMVARISRRLNRFLLEVKVKDSVMLAHMNNTGRLMEYIVSGRTCYCVRRERPGKTSYRLFAVEDRGLGAIVDTRAQMVAFEESLGRGLITWLEGCRVVKRNVRLGSSVIDMLLECNGSNPIYLEVKSAVMRGDTEYAMYPDCPSQRGRRHVRELIEYVKGGGRAVLLFVSSLPHVKMFKPNRRGDPEIYRLLVEAARVGVELRSISVYYDPTDSYVYLDNPDLPVTI